MMEIIHHVSRPFNASRAVAKLAPLLQCSLSNQVCRTDIWVPGPAKGPYLVVHRVHTDTCMCNRWLVECTHLMCTNLNAYYLNGMPITRKSTNVVGADFHVVRSVECSQKQDGSLLEAPLTYSAFSSSGVDDSQYTQSCT